MGVLRSFTTGKRGPCQRSRGAQLRGPGAWFRPRSEGLRCFPANPAADGSGCRRGPGGTQRRDRNPQSVLCRSEAPGCAGDSERLASTSGQAWGPRGPHHPQGSFLRGAGPLALGTARPSAPTPPTQREVLYICYPTHHTVVLPFNKVLFVRSPVWCVAAASGPVLGPRACSTGQAPCPEAPGKGLLWESVLS